VEGEDFSPLWFTVCMFDFGYLYSFSAYFPEGYFPLSPTSFIVTRFLERWRPGGAACTTGNGSILVKMDV
jgi:hypothetical protein